MHRKIPGHWECVTLAIGHGGTPKKKTLEINDYKGFSSQSSERKTENSSHLETRALVSCENLVVGSQQQKAFPGVCLSRGGQSSKSLEVSEPRSSISGAACSLHPCTAWEWRGSAFHSEAQGSLALKRFASDPSPAGFLSN